MSIGHYPCDCAQLDVTCGHANCPDEICWSVDVLRSYRQGAIDALGSLLEGLNSAPAVVWCERGVRETIESLIGQIEDLMPRDETGRPI